MLAIAFLRVFIEVMGIDVTQWPLAKKMGAQWAHQFHRTGLIFSIGFILLFAPGVLLN